jgi:hypothetical protein
MVLPNEEQWLLFYLSPVLQEMTENAYVLYTTRDHKYPELASHISQVLMPNLAAFSGIYCLKDKRPFHNVMHSSTEMFFPGSYNF